MLPARGHITLDFLLQRGLASAPAAAVRSACADSDPTQPSACGRRGAASAEIGPYLSYDVYDSCAGAGNGHSEFAGTHGMTRLSVVQSQRQRR